MASSRYPGKPLALAQGVPVICHVIDVARSAWPDARVVVATDSPEIAAAAEPRCGVFMSRESAACGTDRVAEVAAAVSPSPEWIINLQGDEPCLPPDVLRDTLARLISTPSAAMATACLPRSQHEDFFNPDVVKVTLDADDHALYFSRAPIPHGAKTWMQHIGLYAFHRESLQAFRRRPPAPLERLERLEQLRALAAGWTIALAILERWRDASWPALNRPEDLPLIERFLSAHDPITTRR